MRINSLTLIRSLLAFFIVALIAAGLTAFPLQWELDLLNRLVSQSPLPAVWPGMAEWIAFVNIGVQETYTKFPFMAYGTDWLAFAHIVIAIGFVGAFRDPVRNVWVIEWGMLACVLVIVLAVIMGPIRGIPFFWSLVDCSFGVGGITPLWWARREIKKIENARQRAQNTSYTSEIVSKVSA